jgi:hypothetical protein
MKYRDFDLTFTQVVYENLLLPSRPRALINDDSQFIFEQEARALSYDTFFNFYDSHLMESFIENETTPHLLIETEGAFKHLDNFVYNNGIIEYLNATGLHIYLKELPYFGLDATVDAAAGVINCNDVKTLKEVIDKIKPTIIGVDLTEQNLKDLICYEFEKISSFVKNNNLTNVTVFCGQYQIDLVLQHKYPNIKLKLADVGHTVISRPSKNDSFSFMSYNKNTPVPDIDLIKYKFWCGNKSYEGVRQLVAAYMLDKPALLSYYHRNFDYSIIFNNKELHINDFEYFWNNINNRIWFNFNSLKEKDATVFYKLLIGVHKLEMLKTITIDKHTTDPNFQEWMSPGDWVAKDDPVPLDHYASCFCAVVTESLFAFPFGNFCDKVVNAVKCYRPIVLVGCPKTLEYMQKKGFKTFSDYWDESYDQELNHEQRLLKIFKVVDYINSKSLDELKYMYNDMIPILQHNHKIVGTFALTKSWIG